MKSILIYHDGVARQTITGDDATIAENLSAQFDGATWMEIEAVPIDWEDLPAFDPDAVHPASVYPAEV